MDVTEINALIHDAFGPGADIFNDVLRVPASAPQSQVQQAFFDRRFELCTALNINSESNGDGTSRATTKEKRDQVRKKIDALAASFRLLSNPVMRKEYVKSKLSSPPQTPTKVTIFVQSTPRSTNSQRNSPNLTPRKSTIGTLQPTPRSSSGKVIYSPQEKVVDDEFDMIASRHHSTGSESSSQISSSEHSDEGPQPSWSIGPQNLTTSQTKTQMADTSKSSTSNRITVEHSYTSTFQSAPSMKENDDDSLEKIINCGPGDEVVISVTKPKNPIIRNINTDKQKSKNYSGRVNSNCQHDSNVITECPADLMQKRINIKPNTTSIRGKSKSHDESTVTTEYSEDLSFEPGRLRPAHQKYTERKENKRFDEEEEDEDEDDDDDDEYTYDNESIGKSEYTTSYESTVYTTQTYGQMTKDRNPDMCGCAQEDVQGSLIDTISALDQVLHVFSISDTELHEFSQAIHRAEKDLE